jgi:hypothetical protein
VPAVRAAGAPPVVVVGTLRDPVTPYRWSVELAGALRSAVLVTVGGDTHTSFGQGLRCLDPQITRYLVNLTVPPDRRCDA